MTVCSRRLPKTVGISRHIIQNGASEEHYFESNLVTFALSVINQYISHNFGVSAISG